MGALLGEISNVRWDIAATLDELVATEAAVSDGGVNDQVADELTVVCAQVYLHVPF